MNNNIANDKLLVHTVKALNFVGFIRFKNEKYGQLKNIIGITVIIVHVLYNVTQIIFLYQSRDDLHLTIINAGTTFLVISLYTKSINLFVHRKQFEDLCTRIHESILFYEEKGNAEENLIIEKCINNFAVILRIISATIGSTCLLFASSHVINFFIIYEYISISFTLRNMNGKT